MFWDEVASYSNSYGQRLNWKLCPNILDAKKVLKCWPGSMPFKTPTPRGNGESPKLETPGYRLHISLFWICRAQQGAPPLRELNWHNQFSDRRKLSSACVMYGALLHSIHKLNWHNLFSKRLTQFVLWLLLSQEFLYFYDMYIWYVLSVHLTPNRIRPGEARPLTPPSRFLDYDDSVLRPHVPSALVGTGSRFSEPERDT